MIGRCDRLAIMAPVASRLCNQNLNCESEVSFMKSKFTAALLFTFATTVAAQTAKPPSQAAAKTPGVVTDRRLYSEGAPPPLPRAGGTFVDPIFGTTIMRVTDERDGTSCNNFYSYWPTFNLDSTRFLIACDGNAKLYRFDPTNFKVLDKGPLFDKPI